MAYVEALKAFLTECAPIFAKELDRTMTAEPVAFHNVTEPMLKEAENALGRGWAEQLVNGYFEFVLDVYRPSSPLSDDAHLARSKAATAGHQSRALE